MARFSAGVRTGAGSTTLPIISLYNAASGANAHIVEIGVFNTTATAVALKLIRLTTAGTQGAGLTETAHESVSGTANCTGFTTHSVAPTLGGDLGYNVVLGAAIGSGVIWTFGGQGGGLTTGLVGTGNGLGVIVATGTGQVVDAYLVWDE
jgi:hypothetical protein